MDIGMDVPPPPPGEQEQEPDRPISPLLPPSPHSQPPSILWPDPWKIRDDAIALAARLPPPPPPPFVPLEAALRAAAGMFDAPFPVHAYPATYSAFSSSSRAAGSS